MRDLLIDDTAGHPGATAAQRFRCIGVIITSLLYHQGATGKIGRHKPRGQDRMYRRARGIDIQRRQIAQMAFTIGALMGLGFSGIVMTACC